MIGSYLSLLDTPEEKKIFEQLYKKYKSIMYNNAYSILKDTFLAEDAVHNAFMSLIKSFEKVDKMNDDEKRNYILIINRNAAYAIYNKSKNTEPVENDVMSSENIELDFEITEKTDKIFEIVKSLDKNYSDVLVLKLFYEMSDNEIAEALNITIENARVRIFRGRNKLKALLREELENDRKWFWYIN